MRLLILLIKTFAQAASLPHTATDSWDVNRFEFYDCTTSDNINGHIAVDDFL